MPFDPTPNELFPFGVGDYPIALGANTWDNTPRRTVAGAQGFAADGLTPNLRTNAQHLNNWLGTVQEWHQQGLDLRHVGNFGDGSDGIVTEVGNRTLTRVHYYEDWTIGSGFRVTTAGYPVFVRGVLTIDGAGSALEWNGNDAILDVGGLAQASTVLTGGVAGGSGLFGAGPTAGADSTNTAQAGAGGIGGDGSVPAAAGGVATLADADARSLDVAMRGATIRQGVLTALTAGAGGGGGGPGANVGIDGGGGGGGAGHMLICARSIQLLNGATIELIGGAGADGIDGVGVAGGGGGGGGMGGLMYVLYREHDIAGGSILVTGGAPGAALGGTPSGLVGVIGGAGQIISIPG